MRALAEVLKTGAEKKWVITTYMCWYIISLSFFSPSQYDSSIWKAAHYLIKPP